MVIDMAYQSVFKRLEQKYIITKEQSVLLKELIADYMHSDSYGKSKICNLYFDTPDYLLIRRSVEKPVFKEKLRVRSYGTASPDSTVFAEIKRKYKGVVYKRRINIKERDVIPLLCERKFDTVGQISHEIDYFLKQYSSLAPRFFISYDREAFYSNDDENFRITFDENIVWRTNDLSLCSASYGEKLLPDTAVLMEIKSATAIPLWLTDFLSKNQIYKTSFSKYGEAYKTNLLRK